VTGAPAVVEAEQRTAPPGRHVLVQYRRPLTLRRSPKLIPPAQGLRAERRAQEPYGASIGAGEGVAGEAVAGAVVAGAAECDVIAANSRKERSRRVARRRMPIGRCC